VLGVALGAVFGFKTRSEDQEARGVCPTGVCASQSEIAHHDQLVADAKSHRTYAIVGLAGGGVALAAGAILFLTAARAPAGADTRVALWGDGRQAAGVTVLGRW